MKEDENLTPKGKNGRKLTATFTVSFVPPSPGNKDGYKRFWRMMAPGLIKQEECKDSPGEIKDSLS